MINNSKKIKINKVSNMSKMSGNGSITSMMFLFITLLTISHLLKECNNVGFIENIWCRMIQFHNTWDKCFHETSGVKPG